MIFFILFVFNCLNPRSPHIFSIGYVSFVRQNGSITICKFKLPFPAIQYFSFSNHFISTAIDQFFHMFLCLIKCQGNKNKDTKQPQNSNRKNSIYNGISHCIASQCVATVTLHITIAQNRNILIINSTVVFLIIDYRLKMKNAIMASILRHHDRAFSFQIFSALKYRHDDQCHINAI